MWKHFAMALSSKLGNRINADYYLIHKTSAFSARTLHICTDAYKYTATKIDPSHDSYDSNIQKLIASTGGITCRLGAAQAVKQHFKVSLWEFAAYISRKLGFEKSVPVSVW